MDVVIYVGILLCLLLFIVLEYLKEIRLMLDELFVTETEE